MVLVIYPHMRLRSTGWPSVGGEGHQVPVPATDSFVSD